MRVSTRHFTTHAQTDTVHARSAAKSNAKSVFGSTVCVTSAFFSFRAAKLQKKRGKNSPDIAVSHVHREKVQLFSERYDAPRPGTALLSTRNGIAQYRTWRSVCIGHTPCQYRTWPSTVPDMA
eukprot:1348739-Rhodomonas_salina.2